MLSQIISTSAFNWQTGAACLAAHICSHQLLTMKKIEHDEKGFFYHNAIADLFHSIMSPPNERMRFEEELTGFFMSTALVCASAIPLKYLSIPIQMTAIIPTSLFITIVQVVSNVLFPHKIKASETIKPKDETLPEPELHNLHDLVSYFDSKWDALEKEYKGIKYNPERIVKNLASHAKKFGPQVDYSVHHGFIEKKEVPKGSKVFVRADLHGDLKSLLENLKAIQQEGLVDENFKCKPGTYMVFCGDYMDRGNYSMEIAEVLAMLQMENPDQVFIIRGNHEQLSTNFVYRGLKDVNFKQFLEKHSDVLTSFYKTMPLTVYLAEDGGEFVHFTHGLFELHIDPSEMLDSSDKTRMNIPIKPQEFSERVQKLAAHATPVKYGVFLKAVGYRDHEPSKYELAAKHLIEIHDDVTSETHSIYNWGDIENKHNAGINIYTGRPQMTIAQVKDALRLMGNVRKVKLLFRGHQHRFQHEKHQGKVVATTLPVGADTGYYQIAFNRQPDRAYILKTGQKVKDWKKYAFIRKSGETEVEITSAYNIFNEAI